MSIYKETLEAIEPLEKTSDVYKKLEKEIDNHLNDLTKPQGSLGKLEELAKRFCFIQNSSSPRLQKKAIAVFAADHGVAVEGVSAYPSEVTAQMVLNMLAGGAAINVLSRHGGIKNYIVDVGVNASDDFFKNFSALDNTNLKFIESKIMRGSNNFLQAAAMSEEQTIQAMEVGIQTARELARDGVDIVGTGEMGIGNTSSAAALLAVLLPASVAEVTGRGTGIDEQVLAKKISVIEAAIDFHKDSLSSPLQILRRLGGLEIAAICGFILSAASQRMAIVVDGFISSAAALTAMRLVPAVKDYLFFSHLSAELGHKKFMVVENISPILNLGMRLGEGSGAALAVSIIEASVKVYNEMATFSSAGVSGESR